MEQGQDLLESGQYETAMVYFEMALAYEGDSDLKKAQVHQMNGICLRLMRELDKAVEEFDIALSLAQDDKILAAKINRDLGMIYLVKSQVSDEDYILSNKALHCFRELSYDVLKKYDETIEAAVSLGFIGRVHFVQESHYRARLYMREAYIMMKSAPTFNDNPVYERNCLLWLSKVSLWYRYRYLFKLINLSLKTNSKSRIGEAILLAIGGNPLYNIVDEFCRR